MTNSSNTPIEVFERTYGMAVRALRIRRGSGGEGAAPGGDGIERELEAQEPTTVSLIAERHASRPWGLAGGRDGAPGEHWLLPGGDESAAVRLRDKCVVHLDVGDVLRILTPGGGGWGEGIDVRETWVEPVTEDVLASEGEWLVIPSSGSPITLDDVQDLRDGDQR